MMRPVPVSCAAASALLSAVLLAGAPPARAADGLAFVEAVFDGERGVDGVNGVQALALSPDTAGAHLYVAGTVDDEVAIFARDAQTGALRFIARSKDGQDGIDGLDAVRGLAFDPDGAFLYTVASRDDALAVFRRDPATGLLTFVERERDNVDGVEGLDGAEAVAVSPDGLHVYAVGHDERAVAVFAREAGTGAVTFASVVRDSVGGVNGLKGARGLAISADGKHVYVSGDDDDNLVLFTRDPSSGALTFVERYQDGDPGIDGLAGPAGVVVSPDGANVYVGGDDDDAVAVFARNPSDGKLTFVELERDGVGGVEGLDGVESVAVSPDGSHVYAGGSDEQALVVFRRDPGTGALTFAGFQKNGIGNVVGLDGVGAVVLSADGRQLYAGGTDDDAVAVFDSRCGDGVVDPREQCDDGDGSGGDGCSAGCRSECTAAAGCDDGDVCTEQRCNQGECARPRCAFEGGLCQVEDVRAALLADTACTPVAPKLARAVAGRLRTVRRVLKRANRQPDPNRSRVVTRVEDALDKLATKADSLADRQRISPACRAAVAARVDALTADVRVMVLRQGPCAP
jgi:cysteine-rich repeat protein